jgi:hypothetical protein
MTSKTKTQTKTQTAPKPKKLQTKTEVRNAGAQADKLIRGIANNDESILKHQEQIEKKIQENGKNSTTLRSLIAGISNVAMTTPAPAAKVQAKPAPKASAKKPAPKKPAAKAKVQAKPAAKSTAKSKPAAKASSSTGWIDWRKQVGSDGKLKHKLDEVAADVISKFTAKNGRSPTAADIFHGCEVYAKAEGFKDKHGNDDCWSRQSLYNQLKITARFTKSGDGPTATFQNAGAKASAKSATDQDAEEYVKKVEKNTSVAHVS